MSNGNGNGNTALVTILESLAVARAAGAIDQEQMNEAAAWAWRAGIAPVGERPAMTRVEISLNDRVYFDLTDRGVAYVRQSLQHLFGPYYKPDRVAQFVEEIMRGWTSGSVQVWQFMAMFGSECEMGGKLPLMLKGGTVLVFETHDAAPGLREEQRAGDGVSDER